MIFIIQVFSIEQISWFILVHLQVMFSKFIWTPRLVCQFFTWSSSAFFMDSKKDCSYAPSIFLRPNPELILLCTEFCTECSYRILWVKTSISLVLHIHIHLYWDYFYLLSCSSLQSSLLYRKLKIIVPSPPLAKSSFLSTLFPQLEMNLPQG